MVAQLPAAGVAGQRHHTHLQQFIKAFFIQVGNVHGHPKPLHFPHRFPAKGLQAGGGILACRGGHAIIIIPGEGRHAYPLPAPVRKHFAMSVQQIAPFHRQHECPFAFFGFLQVIHLTETVLLQFFFFCQHFVKGNLNGGQIASAHKHGHHLHRNTAPEQLFLCDVHFLVFSIGEAQPEQRIRMGIKQQHQKASFQAYASL